MTKEELIELNPTEFYTNICAKCGAENTLYPHWRGKRKIYICEGCGEISKGITRTQWEAKNNMIKKIGTMIAIDKTTETIFGSEVRYMKCDTCGTEEGSNDHDEIKNMIGKPCESCKFRIEMKEAEKKWEAKNR